MQKLYSYIDLLALMSPYYWSLAGVSKVVLQVGLLRMGQAGEMAHS